MKIVFIGSVNFSQQFLKKILSLKGNVVGVLTSSQPGINADYADLSDLCRKYRIPIRKVENINDAENVKWIQGLRSDIIFCFGFSQLLKEEILQSAPLGVVGYHPAKLPQNRGRHPIIWALALGLPKTASTFFFMDQGADSGDILSQQDIEISYQDTASTLYRKATKVALKQIEEFLPQLQKGRYARRPQDHTKAGYWRRRNMDDGRIDFKQDSRSIYNLVRALSKPYVGAHVVYKNENIKVWKVKEVKQKLSGIECGQILKANKKEILVKCRNAGVVLSQHEFKQLPKVGEFV